MAARDKKFRTQAGHYGVKDSDSSPISSGAKPETRFRCKLRLRMVLHETAGAVKPLAV
jgi:hypothetical protein